MEIEIPFNEENLLTTHACVFCSEQLVSAMDVEIQHLVAEVGVRLPDNPFYDANY